MPTWPNGLSIDWERMSINPRQDQLDNTLVPADGPRRESTIAWLASLLLHCGVILALVLWGWSTPGAGLASEGADVGIVIDAGGDDIRPDRPASDVVAAQTVPLDPDILPAETAAEHPVTQLESDPFLPEPQLEAIIGIEAGADAPEQGATDVWDGVLAGSAATAGGSATFFGLRAEGSRFVYVVDCSSSMRGAKLRAAKNELIRSLRALNADMQFYIIFYNHRYVAMPADGLVPATDAHKIRFEAWVEGIPAAGSTNPTPAVLLALSLRPNAIWLLSDGLFESSAADAIRQANPRAGVQIHTIAFHDNHGEPQLRRIAEENRGQYRFVPRGEQRAPSDSRGGGAPLARVD